MKKQLIPLLFTLISVSGASFAGSITEIRFGVDPTFPPFESKTTDGHIVGFDIDLGNAICQKLQAKCSWVESNFDGIIPALKAKKFDAILSAMYVTEKRKEQLTFSDKIYSGPIFVVARKNTITATDAGALKNKTIGVEQGSVQETYANKYWRNAGVNVVAYQGADQIIPDLESGRIDAAALAGVMAEYSFLNKEQGKDFTFVGNALQDKTLFTNGDAIGLRKEDTELQQAINGAIAQIIADGTYKKLAAKYFTFDIYAGS
ncbi:transporter substrate-binding domain-containing protein [[Enterobacter] lignolyticus]|uniref:Extracellular solute-binding protein family 3 n=1 Tax=Enterobacter lignolyticus (strain SCF1) TaxID=701347 RepID=E3GA92_ENTLS|nr:transporter substrate-binding domain-containing protein [[Enterobacter] lignolyticus]ADO47628.1 extracellular solute-binding protein family 3 [[Enterobacter] lignolyticus SCF1]